MRFLRWLLGLSPSTAKPARPEKPVRRGKNRVHMVASVGTDHVAGNSYDLDGFVADLYIARGYATGEYSRVMTDDEIRELRSDQLQEVRI